MPVPAHGSVHVTDDGTLLVLGTEDDDQIYITYGYANLSLNGEEYYLDDPYNPPFPPFTRIEVRGGGGDDRISAFQPDYPYSMYPLAPTSIVFDGGDGNDTFTILDTIGYVIGGAGDDVVQLAFSSRLHGFDDVSGIDTIDASVWDGYPGIVDLRLYPTIENAISQTQIIGNDLDNLLMFKNGGNYPGTVLGGNGNDIIMSDAAGGLLDGGAGDDYLIGESGQYWAPLTLVGGAGGDTLVGDDGTTYLEGEVINPPSPPDPISSDGQGNVTISGSDGAGVIHVMIFRPQEPYGGEPAGVVMMNDVPHPLWPWRQLNHDATIAVLGKGGDDRIEMRASGAGVRGYFDGGDGDDTLIGGSYADTLIGGNGKDLFYARDGVVDSIFGGAGNDKAEANAVDVLIDVKGKKSVKGKKN